MKSDSAAAIALTRTGLSTLQAAFLDSETDLLVDNESVVVYNERTSV